MVDEDEKEQSVESVDKAGSSTAEGFSLCLARDIIGSDADKVLRPDLARRPNAEVEQIFH